MQEFPLISVIIPVYNTEQYLSVTILFSATTILSAVFQPIK